MFVTAVVLVLVYLGLLSGLARWGDGQSAAAKRVARHPLTYSFSLAIYCTAWTFFGAVGEANESGWAYLPILLGPALLFLLGTGFLSKLALVSKKQRITTIADFIVSRYGKRATTGLMVTFIALLAAVPYIALQLKAIGMAFSMFVGANTASLESVVLVAAVLLGIFAAFFGTQKVDASEYRSGLMLAIAFESLFKLLALVVLGLVAAWLVWGGNLPSLPEAAPANQDWHVENLWSFNFLVQTCMAAAAAILLPRQFHVAIVDNPDVRQIKRARWMFPLYLAVIAVMIPIIARAGAMQFGHTDVDPDLYVLALAGIDASGLLSLIVILGGVSAATAMIIVSTLTLSTMISNDVVLPMLLRHTLNEDASLSRYRGVLFRLRRISIGVILLLAYLYYRQSGSSVSLNSTGLVAFSLILQLLPAVVGGLYWKKGHAFGVYAGLSAGFLCWLLFVLMPLQDGQMQTGLAQFSDDDLISRGAFVALLVNIAGYVVFSLMARERLVDRIQAAAFVSPKEQLLAQQPAHQYQATVADVKVLLETFLGAQRTQSHLFSYEKEQGLQLDLTASPDPQLVDYCERLLGGVLGSSSARALMLVVTSGKQMMFEDVINVFDDTTQAIRFNQSLLYTSLENLEQGISVIDKDLNLVAWNRRYLEMFDYPDGLVQVGQPVENLVRFNAERGECGVGEIEALVRKRLDFMRSGSAHQFLRRRSDGRVIEMIGRPLPDGGFVTSFSDVTEYIETRHALKDANIDLEKRVAERAQEVKEINAELRHEIQSRKQAELEMEKAKRAAEQANASKTRFLALASHDILQPLNASKLYLSTLMSSSLPEEQQALASKVSQTVDAAESLIATLLEIARLDQGAMSPKITSIEAKPLLQQLVQEFTGLAQAKGLRLDSRIQAHVIQADPTYLRRIVQNMLSNAIKYTPSGRVLLTCRKVKNRIQIAVYDTGPGISDAQQRQVFEDFYRIDDSAHEPGMGLGLGVVQRMGRLLNTEVRLKSQKGTGACFYFYLQQGDAAMLSSREPAVGVSSTPVHLALSVICIDDESVNLDAMQTLLHKWGCEVRGFNGLDALLAAEPDKPDVVLVDYQLNAELDGIAVIAALRQRWGVELPASLVTAVRDEDVVTRVKQQGIHYLPKPVKPAKLRAMLSRIARD